MPPRTQTFLKKREKEKRGETIDSAVKRKLFIAIIILFLVLFVIANIIVFFGSDETEKETTYEETQPPLSEIVQAPEPQPTPSPPPPLFSQEQGTLAYVINQMSNDVWLINLEEKTILKKVKVGNMPTAGFYDDGMLYVTNTKDNTISVINTLTNSLIDTIPTGKTPEGIVVIKNKIYVANKDDYTISVINIQTKKTQAEIDIKKPTSLLVSPLKDKIYAISSFSNDLAFINPNIDKIIKLIKVGTTPHALALSPDNLYFAVTNTESNDISLIPLKLQKETARIRTGITPIHAAFTQDNKFLFVVNRDSADVAVISMFTEEVIQAIPLKGAPTSILIKDHKAYVTTYNTHTITVIDTQNLKIIDTIYTGLGPIAIIMKENA